MARIEIKAGISGTFWAEWNGGVASCKGCGQSIGWAKTKKEKWIPFDLPEFDAEAVASHWSTCPNGDKFRKGKENGTD